MSQEQGAALWLVEGSKRVLTTHPVSFEEALRLLSADFFIHHAQKRAAVERMKQGEKLFSFSYGFASGRIYFAGQS